MPKKSLPLKKVPEGLIVAIAKLGPCLKQRTQRRLDLTKVHGPKVLRNRQKVRGDSGENVAWWQNNNLSLAFEGHRIGIVGPNEIGFAIELWTSH